MIVQASQKRLQWLLIAVGSLVDVAVAVVAAYFLAEPGDRLTTAFWIWVAIQVVGIAFWLLGLLRTTVGYKLGAFNVARDTLLAALEAHKFPKPDAYVVSVDDYLTTVADDEEVATNTRIIASHLLGVRQGLGATSGLIRSVMLTSAHEAAITRYRDNFRR